MRIFFHPDKARVEVLLQSNGLPITDLSALDFDHFLGCGSRHRPEGVIGLELLGSDALLRSLVVDEQARGSGCGKALVDALEQYAKRCQIESLYLLTDTAEHFFLQLDYKKIDREVVPAHIQQSREFSELCPDNAVVMMKRFNRV